MGRPGYCTREAVKTALDSKATSRDDEQIDRAVLSACETVDGFLHWAHIDPRVDTRYFDFPNRSHADPGRLWLDNQGLISLTTATTGGDSLTPADLLLEPVNDGPPFVSVNTDFDTDASYGGATGWQHNIALTGLWGYADDQRPAGALAEALDSSETGVDVTDGSKMGVGSLLVCESERMIVTARGWLDSGQNLGTNLDDLPSAQLVNLTSGVAFNVGESILIDAEEMLLVGIAGNNGVVQRAWNGSTLAAHTSGADIYASRTLTVERGANGTTAAAHNTATALTVWRAPQLIESLAIAEAQVQVAQEEASYARTVGEGEAMREAAGRALTALRDLCWTAHGRNRIGAV